MFITEYPNVVISSEAIESTLGTIHIQFSRPPTPLVQLRPKFFHPHDLGRPVLTNDNQSIERKHNPRMIIICFQVFPLSRLLLSVSAH